MSSSRSGAFPPKRVVTLNYVQIQPISRDLPGAGPVVSSYYMSCNSIHDPDALISGAPGHQPYYHDQLMALYRNYSVLSSTCTCYMYGGTTGVLFGSTDYNQIPLGDFPVDYLDTFDQSQLERPGVKQSIMANAAGKAKVTLHWNCKTAAIDRDQNTGILGDAGTGTDPAIGNIFRFGFCLMQTPGGADDTTLNRPNAMIRMRFKVLLSNPRHQAIS